MKITWKLAAYFGLTYVCASCASRPLSENSFILERIPIEIQRGKPVIFTIRARSPGGLSEVGVRCSLDVWNTLTNGPGYVNVKLLSSNTQLAEVTGIPPGYGAFSPVSSFHDLFWMKGLYRLFPRATVQITFPNAPSGVTHAEVFVCRMPTDSL